MTMRLLLLTSLLLASTSFMTYATRSEEVALRRPLKEMPFRVGEFDGRDTGRFTGAVERILQADEYINRLYSEAGAPPVSLYVGYYSSQRSGETMHSPMNCLPGAGWQPVESARMDIPIGRSSIRVNRYVIEKGLDRQVVLYWYHSHGRAIASEYWSKIYTVIDAVRLNRTDAALVRAISPVLAHESDDAAAARVMRFVQYLYPLLAEYLPS